MFPVEMAKGTVLDKLGKCVSVTRSIYGHDQHTKPNDHCNWVNIGIYAEVWVWEENDEHLRKRFLKYNENTT